MQKDKKNIIVKDMQNLSYTDFVGFINQWNVLPGSYVTLSKWAQFSRMNQNSRLLEVACTTGFSSRELAVMTGCRGEGFDLSEQSVAMANYNKEHYAPHINFSYVVANGYDYRPKGTFTHIAVGAGLQFFSDPQKMLDRCISMLEDGGCLLASPFYVMSPIPEHLIKRAENIFQIIPTTVSYKEIMQMYNKFEILYEDRNYLIPETDEELRYYCKSTIDRTCKMHDITNQTLYDVMYNRLLEVKQMSNDLRPYQMYSVLVLRYRTSVYPNRFVELF